MSNAYFEELLWVHGMIRRDLETVRRLAAEVLDGRAPAEVGAEIRSLQTSGPLWKLKFGCLHYCRFVHAHHGAEDRLLFPVLRQVDPALGPVVDRLEEDHRTVSDLLDAVERSAEELTASGSTPARTELAQALDVLAEHLLAHLALEEDSVGPAMALLSPG